MVKQVLDVSIPPPRSDVHHSHLLLIDDDPSLLDALSDALRLRLGHFTVDTCETSTKALNCVKAKRYDAIISDVNMPGIHGLELLTLLRQARPTTPVVIISGHADHAFLTRAFQAGAADFSAKPIDREAFMQSIRRALNISRLRVALERQEALIIRTRNHYSAIVEKLSATNERWLLSSASLFSRDSEPQTSSSFSAASVRQEQHERKGQCCTEQATRELTQLDAFLNRVGRAHQDTSALLQAAEDEMRSHALLRLQRAT
jgi:FixJ family two-component response regulator